jgi:peptidoglycan/LPS O-acetylase OafA/YrhL
MAGVDGVPRIHTLDGLRGWLALYVAVYHLSAPLTQDGLALAWLKPWMGAAWWTVDMFFVMSGFVMMHVYRDVFAQRIKLADGWHFMKARWARLYPVHVLALVLMLPGFLRMPDHAILWQIDDGRYSAEAFVKSLLMLHGPWMDARSWNYPAWSISAEWHAYLLFPVLAWVMQRAISWLPRWTPWACCGVPWLVYWLGAAADPHPTNGDLLMWRVLPLFLAGMLCRGLFARNVAGWGLAPVLAAGLLASPWPELAVMTCPAVLLWALSSQGARVGLAGSVSVWLGKVSYSLYMTHALVEMYVVQGGLRQAAKLGLGSFGHQGGAALAWLLVAVAVALILAAGVQRWVETPCRKMLLGGHRKPRVWA